MNVVHDPQEEEGSGGAGDADNMECQELGTANLNILEVSIVILCFPSSCINNEWRYFN